MKDLTAAGAIETDERITRSSTRKEHVELPRTRPRGRSGHRSWHASFPERLVLLLFSLPPAILSLHFLRPYSKPTISAQPQYAHNHEAHKNHGKAIPADTNAHANKSKSEGDARKAPRGNRDLGHHTEKQPGTQPNDTAQPRASELHDHKQAYDAHKHANPNKEQTEGHSESCRVIAGNWGRLNNQPRERKPSAPARTLQKYSAENHHWQKSAHEQPLKKVKQQYQ